MRTTAMLFPLLLLLAAGCTSQQAGLHAPAQGNATVQAMLACTNYSVEECPATCAVCPPCPECSSIRCQSRESCNGMGFNSSWWYTVNPANHQANSSEAQGVTSGNGTKPVANESGDLGQNDTGQQNASAARQNISQMQNPGSESKSLNETGLEFGDYSLAVEDLSLASGPSGASCAIIGIYSNANGSKLAELQDCPGQSAYWVAPDGHRWRIMVYQTAPGYSGAEAWAEIAVFG